MDIYCPVDERCSAVISALLEPLPPLKIQEYYERLLASRNCSTIQVKLDGEFGKGVYAQQDFAEGELIFRDQMLFGCQHPSNKIECMVCSSCFRFIGTVEQQIGRRLYLQSLGLSSSHGCDADEKITDADVSSDTSDDENIGWGESNEEPGGSGSRTRENKKLCPPKEMVETLMRGEFLLPHSDKFLLPPIVPCPGGCKEVFYCSKLCADADWDSCHSLLCLGEKSKAPSRAALDKFTQHANETNDIFLLAAKAIAYTILRYRKLKTSCERKRKLPDSSDCFDLSLLREAWRPISMGHKRRWWECMALPEDVDSSEEVTFRMQIKELAFQSLQLLKDAIYDKECEALFSLELYGQIIGMFELNNLDLVVASPVEDYFLYIDDLHSPEKEEVEKVSHQFLDALGEEYAVSCEGTAFFPIQSCMNHSCQPNARAFKREEDRDGEATILACKPIHKGEEITISYIDESLPFEERRAALPDYGFTCRCSKCQEES
ncbi:hypothetical protein MLD38_033395 [Melastoma candidum]|uniref:Uncharacterized protein n=1 Tax=Melastoma candidum TaxID=119954 RepID=A0ACB9M6L6_9MYRT|nr:hypothetical protein MLD38_033395 [Melastoma candidum]